MIEIIALIKIKNNDAYVKYETKAVSIMKQHGGRLISAFEVNKNESSEMELSEVHYLQFPDLKAFKEYRENPELVKLVCLRGEAISDIKVIVSGESKSYES